MSEPDLPRVLAHRHRRRIGVLGGSFNPAHAGHRAISRAALTYLELDEVWWLVSPQNPLKPTDGMAAFAARIARAGATAMDRRIKVTGLEARLGTRYTAHTLAALRRRFPRTDFVWLMGADNLAQIHRWARWPEIFEHHPVAVFARPGYARALASPAAQRYAPRRWAPERARRIAAARPPAWVFFPKPLVPISATEIRRLEAARS